jgi:hypothetical protein
MAKVNFKQQKRQKEMQRKQRQDERLSRRGEKVAADPFIAPVPEKPAGETQ